MRNFRILVDSKSADISSCAGSLEIIPAKNDRISFESRVEKFFSSFPTITKDWLHYKM